jgi:hypothetical protein
LRDERGSIRQVIYGELTFHEAVSSLKLSIAGGKSASRFDE